MIKLDIFEMGKANKMLHGAKVWVKSISYS